MSKPANTAAIAKGTGKPWQDWLAFLESIGARDLPHGQIARKVLDTGEASAWWAQGIAVAYEQHIGRRVRGQRNDGAFEVAVGRTVSGSTDDVLALWLDAMAGCEAVDGVALAGPPTVSETAKWRYWRCALGDGSRLVATIGHRGEGKAGITVTVEGLADIADRERWRAYWKSALAALG